MTVGGLILGRAATAAGLIGNIMIILVSVVAISNFLIPLNLMSFSIRVLKYFFVIAAAMLGLVGGGASAWSASRCICAVSAASASRISRCSSWTPWGLP